MNYINDGGDGRDGDRPDPNGTVQDLSVGDDHGDDRGGGDHMGIPLAVPAT